ncbi:Leucine-rich repeat-containing protein let-4 [Nymphon striatum]|nr:Leucine-rich repeat-containing protein let-4 [Nymphon striatum]
MADPVLACLAIALLLTGSFCADITCPNQDKIKPCKCETKSNGQNVTIMCNEGITTQVTDSIVAVAEHGIAIASLRIAGIEMDEVPDSFAMGTYAESITITNCNVSLVNERAFNTLQTHLTKLDLTSNLMTKVPTDSLKGLHSLRILFLQFNKIDKIFQDDFSNLHSLLKLNLYGNKIQIIDSRAFSNNKLSYINLGYNEMTTIPSNSLDGLPMLKELILHENKIEKLKASELEKVGTTLSDLDLSNNKIVKIPNHCLQKLSVLDTLTIEYNQIKEIEIKAFVGLEDTLDRLSLAGNKLKEIPSLSLKQLNQLTELDLSHNHLKTIRVNAFEGFGDSLKYLDLQNNQLKKIEVGSLKSLDGLLWLYIQHNKLETLSLDAFAPIFDNIDRIDVHDNPFTCDCQMIWFSSLLTRNIQCNPVKEELEKPKNYQYLPACNDTWVQRLQTMSPEKFVTNSRKSLCNKPLLGIPLSATPTHSMDCTSSASRQTSNIMNNCQIYVIFVLLYLYLNKM